MVCSSVGQAPAALQQFNAANPVDSYSCAANVSGAGLLPGEPSSASAAGGKPSEGRAESVERAGYQLTSNTTCTVAQNASVDFYNDFSCLCVDSTASLGLVNAESGSCATACDQTVDGLVGQPVQPVSSTPSDACIPAEDLGAAPCCQHAVHCRPTVLRT